MKRALIFLLMVPVGGVVGILAAYWLHGVAPHIYEGVSVLTLIGGCLWGLVLSAFCGGADFLSEKSRFRIASVAAAGFSMGVLPLLTVPGMTVRWLIACGGLTAVAAVACSWLTRMSQAKAEM